MGIDIHGWVEVGIFWEFDQRTSWQAVIKIDHLIDRHSDIFYALFGTGLLPRVKFPPIACNRGTPVDASSEVREMVKSDLPDFHGHSWITWQELLAIDWEEGAEVWEGAYILPPEGTGPFRLLRLSGIDLKKRMQGWTSEERQQWEAKGIVTVDGVT